MIYFTEITKANGTGEEQITFQFFPKELPEFIPHMYSTKINRIEYNGGFITNQIIGTFQQPIEWEGCFFGKYEIGGSTLTAKERAQRIKSFMGRPIRVGFSPPDDDFEYKVGKTDAKLTGDKGIYIIEEYEMRVRNYVDIDYKIRLVPHMRQEKIKPMDSDVVIVKVNEEAIFSSGLKANLSASKSKNKTLKNAANAAANSERTLGPSMKISPSLRREIMSRPPKDAERLLRFYDPAEAQRIYGNPQKSN